MKRLLVLSMIIVLSLTVGTVLADSAKESGADLVIRGVIDGPLPGGLPKAVELEVRANIPDLSMYGIGSANNGGGSDGEEFTFPADSANAGDSIWIASETVEFMNWFGFAPNYTSGAVLINGDDAVELFMGGNVIDVFGDINVDGSGEAWEYADGWACRLPGTGPDGTVFDVNNWAYSSPDALDGETSNGTATTPYPILPTVCATMTAVTVAGQNVETNTMLPLVLLVTLLGMASIGILRWRER